MDIKQFIDKNKDAVDKIIVHCHAGISRSSAVAMCVCRYLGLDDIWIWKSSYYPNRWVLEVMNNTLELGFTEQDIKHREEVKRKAWEECEYKNEIEDMFIK